MTEIYKTTRLKIASAIFIILIIIGFLTFRSPIYNYHLSAEQTLTDISLAETLVTPFEAIDMLNSNDDNVVFIDSRSEQDYLSDNFKQAINIPVTELLAKDNYTTLKKLHKDGKTLIIIGKDYLQANDALMMLKQLGFDKIKMISDKAIVLQKLTIEEIKSLHRLEELVFSDTLFLRKINPAQIPDSKTQDSETSITPVKRTKKTKTAGGC